MLDVEARESLEAALAELEDQLAQLDPEWEVDERIEVQKKIEATTALLSDTGSEEDWQDAGPDHVKDSQSGEIAERLPPALVDPATGERYTENPFGYAEPDITRPDGADGPSLNPEEVVKKDLSDSQAEPAEKKSSEATQTRSRKRATKPETETSANVDMRAELDTPAKIFNYYYALCWGAPPEKDGKKITSPPVPNRDVKALYEHARSKGFHDIEVTRLLNHLWEKRIGGRRNLGDDFNWDVLLDAMVEINQDAELRQSTLDYEDVWAETEEFLKSRIDFQTDDESKLWDDVLVEIRRAEDELKVLAAQYERMCRGPRRVAEYLNTMFIQSPSAEDFIARNAKKGSKYVDLPHGRLQQRKVPEGFENFDESAFDKFVAKLTDEDRAGYNLEKRVTFTSTDQRKAVKTWLQQLPEEKQHEAGYRHRPQYQSLSANFGD